MSAGELRATGRRACSCSSCPRWRSSSKSTARSSARPSACPTTIRGSGEIDGRLFPFGFIHLLAERKSRSSGIRMISTNVLPEYQRLGHRAGADAAGLLPKVLEWGIEEAEFSWVLESNQLSRGSLEKGGAKLTKTYRLYDLDEDPPAGGWRAEDAACLLRRGADRSSPALVGRFVPSAKSRRDLDRFLRVPWRDLRRGPALGAAAAAGGEGVSRPPQASVLRARRRRRSSSPLRGGEPAGRILVSDDRRYNEEHKRQRRLLRHVRVCRRPGDGPRPAGRRRRLAPRPRPHAHHGPDRLLDSTTPAACWSTASTRRRGS